MPQSLSKLNVHLVFSTKHRTPFITPEYRPALHEYVGGILRRLECPAIVSGSHVDHMHSLFLLSRTITVADVVEEVKKGSSSWMKTQGPDLADFYWQTGYSAFAVSESSVASVKQYIEQQEEHHRKITFQDEYRILLRKHQVEFDERYVWD